VQPPPISESPYMRTQYEKQQPYCMVMKLDVSDISTRSTTMMMTRDLFAVAHTFCLVLYDDC